MPRKLARGCAPSGLLPILVLACVFATEPAGAMQSSAPGADVRVLVLYANGRLLPANVEVDRGLRAALGSSALGNVVVYDEFLDLPRFGGDEYVRTMETYLLAKYASQPPDLIVVAGDAALRFIVDSRARLYPKVPVVHAAVEAPFLQSIAPLPAGVHGLPAIHDFSGTIDQALRWSPRTRRLVIVTGASELDRAWERRLRAESSRLPERVSVEFLAGLPIAAVLERLGSLGRDAVVFTPGFFEDGSGREFLPREAVRSMAAVSGAPVYGGFQTQLGTGIVGGRFADFEAIGRQAGELASEVLAGREAGTIHPRATVPPKLSVDWRQIQRWGIEENAIPRDAVVHFRAPSFLQEHRNEAIAAIVLVLLQAGLIAVLLTERRRRRIAEFARVAQRSELAHASRLAVAGELTASIAHEINQPLGAILSNADAAELILESGGDRCEELRQILGDIRRDDLRASEVIRRLRTLLARQEVERRPFELNDAVREAEALVRPEARRRRVTFDVHPAPHEVSIVGDRVQIQQVVINLLLNAVDAVAGMPDDRRVVSVSVERTAAGVDLTVRDRGEGIVADQLPKLFDSFFTTKEKGMGLGLSIARSIVEAHGGRIRAESVPGEGTALYVALPEGAMGASVTRGDG